MIIRNSQTTYREFSSLMGIDYYLWPFVEGSKEPIPPLVKNIPRFTEPFDHEHPYAPITQDIYIRTKSSDLKDIGEALDRFFNGESYKDLVKNGPKTFWVPDISGQLEGLTQELYDNVIEEYMESGGGNFAVLITKNNIVDDEFWI